MTNDLQQAYDRAMAHNAMLRETIDAADSCLISYKTDQLHGWEIALYSRKREETLDATEADVTAWLAEYFKNIESENDVLREQNLAMIDGIDKLQAENERLKQQLEWQPIPENPENYQIILGWDGKEIAKYMYYSEYYRENPKSYWSCWGKTKKWSLHHQPLKHFVLPQPKKEKIMAKSKTIKHNGKEYKPDRNGWYSMECVPTDGKPVLVFTKDGLKGVAENKNDTYPCETYKAYPWWWENTDSEYYTSIDPIRWQHLPEDPLY